MAISILTDCTVQFPNPVFEGRKQVTILPTRWNGELPVQDPRDLKAGDLPASTRNGSIPTLKAPTAEEIAETFRSLSPRSTGILAILQSSQFSPTYDRALEAAKEVQGKVPIRVIDSLTTSLGLGILVEIAAQSTDTYEDLTELELYVRSLLPRVYSLFCIPGLSYLQRRGYLNGPQALVGEHLGMLPVFTLDNGDLLPGEKARNMRHLVDILHEFLAEFSDLEHIALLQGAPAFEQETRALRERLAEEHRNTPISEQIIGAPLASQIGPHSLGIFALQSS
jgi:DegV family protein with EDD domain